MSEDRIMDWSRLLSSKRFGLEDFHDERKHTRSQFQRDYDRLIFSAPFRRLQNKTQVFPLPGSIFVHNRLTHSLEVSCVGRSLGNNIANAIEEKCDDPALRRKLQGIGDIVATACLAHDMGNPPFGHSGETAIASYFSEGKGQELRGLLGDRLWCDMSHFEGNANVFRLLTHKFNGRRRGGFALTYSTLAAIVKYPYPSILAGKKGKFGYFQSEENTYLRMAEELGIGLDSEDSRKHVRHPLVYLVEAADDICYQIMDIEDACKLHILSKEEVIELLQNFLAPDKLAHTEKVMQMVNDVNEQIAYLRSCIIGLLVDECTQAFINNEEAILAGEFSGALIEHVSEHVKSAYASCSKMAYKKIYCAKEVLDIELAGYRIFSHLIDSLTEAVMRPNHAYSKLLLKRVPEQYNVAAPTTYGKLQCVLDYVSGMTDVYALDLYQKITGMGLPAV